MIRRLLAALTLLMCATGLAACGGSDSSGSGSGKDLPTKTIDVTFSGNDVTPNGDRVDVAVGQPVQFVVQADAAGEIHVHSSPEKELEYGVGKTTLDPITIDKPGIVTVESHALEKTIVQLEVK